MILILSHNIDFTVANIPTGDIYLSLQNEESKDRSNRDGSDLCGGQYQTSRPQCFLGKIVALEVSGSWAVGTLVIPTKPNINQICSPAAQPLQDWKKSSVSEMSK